MNRTIIFAGTILLFTLPAVAKDMDPGAGNNGVSNPGGGYSNDSDPGDDVPLGDMKQHNAYPFAKENYYELDEDGNSYSPVQYPDNSSSGSANATGTAKGGMNEGTGGPKM